MNELPDIIMVLIATIATYNYCCYYYCTCICIYYHTYVFIWIYIYIYIHTLDCQGFMASVLLSVNSKSPLHPPPCRKTRRPDRSVRCRFSDGFLDWSRGIDHWTATPVDGLKKPTKNNPYTPNVNVGHDRMNWFVWKALFFFHANKSQCRFILGGSLWTQPAMH